MQNKGAVPLKTANNIAKLAQAVLWKSELYTIRALHPKTRYVEISKLKESETDENLDEKEIETILVPASELISLEAQNHEMPYDLNGQQIRRKHYVFNAEDPTRNWQVRAWNQEANQIILQTKNGTELSYCDPLYLRVLKQAEDRAGQLLKIDDSVEFENQSYTILDIDTHRQIILIENSESGGLDWINPSCVRAIRKGYSY